MAITFLTQNLLLRLKGTVSRGLYLPALLRQGFRTRLRLEREALQGHVNEVRTRAELLKESDSWLDMISLQFDLFTESRIRLKRDAQARRYWRGQALRQLRAFFVRQSDSV